MSDFVIETVCATYYLGMVNECSQHCMFLASNGIVLTIFTPMMVITLTWLITEEDFITFISHESFKYYVKVELCYKYTFLYCFHQSLWANTRLLPTSKPGLPPPTSSLIHQPSPSSSHIILCQIRYTLNNALLNYRHV
jgi:hypothetical protein